jgi:hypothetical protein
MYILVQPQILYLGEKEPPLEMDDCTNELHNHIQQIVV